MLRLLSVFLLVIATESLVLKTPMANLYSQVALPGCESRKANLFFDRKRQLWIEDLSSSCQTDLENVLQLCRSAFPRLNVTNIVPLSTSLSFKNWCEIVPANDQTSLPSCQVTLYNEETVTPHRCLHDKSAEEESISSRGKICQKQQIADSNKCLSINQFRQRATTFCLDRDEILGDSFRPLTSCALARFTAIEFECCSAKENVQTSDSVASTEEDEPIREVIVVPETKKEPDWYKNSRRSDDDAGLFADDEDIRDERKFALTMSEHQRFAEAKDKFRANFQEQVNELKTQWETRLADIQKLANDDSAAAQRDYENADLQFRREYDRVKQAASRERNRINEEHEKNLDRAISIAQSQAEERLNQLWVSEIREVEPLNNAFYHYIHVLLRDRIHLVNRFSRLRATDPEQAQRKRIAIHERLLVVENLLSQTIDQLSDDPDVQKQILPRINGLINEYDRVNAAAMELLSAYRSVVETTTIRNRRLPQQKSGSLLNSQSPSILQKSPLLFSKYWIWPIIAVMIILIVIGLCLLRCVIVQRRNPKNYTFTSVETRPTEDENLRALQTNGYENPTYKFFEKSHPRC